VNAVRLMRVTGIIFFPMCLFLAAFDAWNAYVRGGLFWPIFDGFNACLMLFLSLVFYLPWALGYRPVWRGFRRPAGGS
jgi:hypothetical protein